MTIEVTDNPSSLKFYGVAARELPNGSYKFERLDRLTWNITVEDKDCDTLTDWLDDHGFAWRLV